MKDTPLTAARLLALYDQVAGAEDAIPRLRRFVLDLAVRGKLVAQDAGDEPAAELLKRIAMEKARLGSKKEKVAPTLLTKAEEPFRIPKSWHWVRLSEILTKLTDGTHHSPPSGQFGDYLYITAKNIKKEGVLLDDVTYVSKAVHDEIFSRCNPEQGDILYIKDGATTGVVTINDIAQPFSMLSSVALLKLPSCLFNRLIAEFLRSPFFFDQMRGFMKGSAIPRVTLSRMGPALFPLPPLAEQRRIVGRVEELMALCDQLQAARAGERAVRDRLTTATLSRLTDPDQPPESAPQNARFALHSLPTLTTHPAQIKTLRQTILNLAVRGKLVEQEASDEPATALQNKLRKSKEVLLKSRTIRNQKVTTTPIDAEATFEIPQLWKWVRLGELVSLLGGYAYKSATYVPKEGNQIIRLGNVKNDEVLHYQRPAYISDEIARQTADFEILKDDILVTMTGTKGKRDFVFTARVKDSDLTQGRLFLNQRVGAIRPFNSDIVPLINLFLKSDILLDWIFETATGTANQANIGVSSILDLPFPLPPLAEQHRIVAKVDALIALCDQLEASLTTATTTRQRLLTALLHEALEPAAALEPA